MAKKQPVDIDAWLVAHQMTWMRLEALADHIKTLYENNRRAYFPYYSGVCDASWPKSFWMKVATILADHGVDPDTYIGTVFELYKSRTQPSQIISRSALDSYARRVRLGMVDTQLALELGLSIKRYKAQASQGRSSEDILKDPGNSFDPLFVWCVACNSNNDALARTVEARARIMAFRPTYRSLYERAFGKEPLCRLLTTQVS